MRKQLPKQLELPGQQNVGDDSPIAPFSRGLNGRTSNRLDSSDRAFHDWYRFVLSFPPHLVRDYIESFGLNEKSVLLDPFCGTGTTLVESKSLGIPAVGIEANVFAHFASSVKVDWGVDAETLVACARRIAEQALSRLAAEGIRDGGFFTGSVPSVPLRKLEPEAEALLLKNSISPLPQHKALTLLECIREQPQERGYRHMLLAFANALVFTMSNLHFGPEVGIGSIKADAPVVGAWLAEVQKMADDLRSVGGAWFPPTHVHLADSRQIAAIIEPASIDAVITSPPYPNEKDYTRTTRLESVFLGLIKSRAELRELKHTLIRSNTRGVYHTDDDDQWVADHAEIQRIAQAIEARRIELNKTSGFEKLYGRVTRLYFGGMARHLADMRAILRPGARLAYVVGDQASYLRIMVRTGQLLAEIAQALGYELDRIDLFRTRFATATKDQLREEVVVLRWPG